MNIIAGGRQTGKTLQLINMSAGNKIPIIVLNEVRKQQLKDYANRLGTDIPEPITINGLTKKVHLKDVYIDDAEYVLQYIFHQQYSTNVSAITMTIGDDNNG